MAGTWCCGDRSVWSDVTTLRHLEIGCIQVTVCCDTVDIWCSENEQVQHLPDVCFAFFLKRQSISFIVKVFVSCVLKLYIFCRYQHDINIPQQSFLCVFLHSTKSGAEPFRRGHRDSRCPITCYHWTYDMILYPFFTVKSNRKFTTVLTTHVTLYLILIIGEDTNIPPLFFPCGSIKREVLPTALRDNGKNFPLLCRTIETQGDKNPTGVYTN